MNPLTRFLNKLAILFRRRRFGSELEEEIEFHRAQAEQELVASGMTPEAAHYAVMRQFGNEMKLMEQSHEEVTFRVEPLVQDLHFALRQWRRNPGFALTSVLILALGMGVSVAIFGFVDASLLQPLPYANPNRLMSVNEGSIEEPRWPLSYLDYLDRQGLNKSFSSLDVYGGAGYLLRTPSGAEPVEGARVSGSFFQTLGVHPMLGRDCLLSKPADAGDRRSHGVGSAAQFRVQARDGAGGVAYASRAGDRAGLLGGSGFVDTEPVVRSAGVGPDDSGLCGCIAGARVDGRELPARSSRGIGEPNGCAASGVT